MSRYKIRECAEAVDFVTFVDLSKVCQHVALTKKKRRKETLSGLSNHDNHCHTLGIKN